MPKKRVLKIKTININANKELKRKFIEMGKPERCEMCGGTWALSFAHRHKRIWYLKQPELLSDINQVLILCIPCHIRIEGKKQMTEEIFKRLRG